MIVQTAISSETESKRATERKNNKEAAFVSLSVNRKKNAAKIMDLTMTVIPPLSTVLCEGDSGLITAIMFIRFTNGPITSVSEFCLL